MAQDFYAAFGLGEDKLGIGTETVRTYVKNICVKLQVKNRTEAVAKHFS